MANLENIRQAVRYETIGNATGRAKNTVKSDFILCKLDAKSPEDVSGYVTKFILAKKKKWH